MLAEVSKDLEGMLPEDLRELYIYEVREKAIFQDMTEIGKISVQKYYLDYLKDESLKEAQRRRCGLCYFHALLSIEALS